MQNKNQQILVLIHRLDRNKRILNHAVKIAKIFRTEILISNSPFSKNNISQSQIEEYTSTYKYINTISLCNTKKKLNDIIKQYNIIFLLIDIDEKTDFKFLLRNNIFSWILNAKIPSLLVGKNTSINTDYSNIIVPIDYKRESKEKMIWASYFGRLNNATIHLFPANEEEAILMKTIRNTLLFTKKLFAQFIFKYEIHKTQISSKHIDKEAFKAITTKESDLIILMTGKTQGIFLLGYSSKKIKHFIQTYSNPILLINPLKDYYLPCESK